MTAFDSCFLFLDNPRGGIEDIAYLKNKCPWLGGVFVNVRSYAPSEWDTVRSRCAQHGLFCGPWGRTMVPGTDANPKFDPAFLDALIRTADEWDAPLIANCEKEIDQSGPTLTRYIADRVAQANQDAALSVEAWPFDSVDWTPVGHLPILPQIFPVEWGAPFLGSQINTMVHATVCKAEWHERGAERVYFTFGTYGGMKPFNFNLRAPYSLFTGDPIMASYTVEQWAPTSSGFDPTDGSSEPPAVDIQHNYSEAVRLGKESIAEWRRRGKDEAFVQSRRQTNALRVLLMEQEIGSQNALSDALDNMGVPEA